MAQYAISIEKSSSFQGRGEVWSNAYTFNTAVGEEFDDVAKINWLVGLEKAVHGSNVTFLTARSYGIAGPDITNVMREVVDLSGTGTQNGYDIYKECALMITWELPRSLILRRRRIGRKWLHICKLRSSPNSGPEGFGNGSAGLPAGDTSFYMTNYATPLTGDGPGGGTFASNGDPFTDPAVSPFLEHRQFPRGRKES